ncbi:sigma-70 family RNA polymerase sigma factor [Planctomicrobium sp. SH661]|uniref:sigma-70 family RNA polymerase sigma factor n=1 Tax=Planctomicrobium sp. SH661 TaxID=3448124 RepID=UPI003F5C42A0
MSGPLSIDELTAVLDDSSIQADFLRLLAGNYRHVYASALAIVGNRDDANDVFQEVCVVLWQKYDEFDQIVNFRKWACAIAYNVAKAHVRKQRRHRGSGMSDQALARIVQFRSAGNELFELRREVLRGCLQKLSNKDRDFLADCYQTSTSLVEIARTKKQTVSAVYSKLKRLRRALTECVQRQFGTGED